jgi:hypothetical protein
MRVALKLTQTRDALSNEKVIGGILLLKIAGLPHFPDRLLIFDLQVCSINALELHLVPLPAASTHVPVLPALRKGGSDTKFALRCIWYELRYEEAHA